MVAHRLLFYMNMQKVIKITFPVLFLLAIILTGVVWYFHYQTITKLLQNKRIELKHLNLVYEFDSYTITKNLPFKIAFKAENQRLAIMEGSGTKVDKESIRFFNLNLDNSTIISSNLLARTFKLKSPKKQKYEDKKTGLKFEHRHIPQILIHYELKRDIDYKSLKSFDFSQLLSTSFKLVQPFNITKIYRKNKEKMFEEIAIFKNTKSQSTFEILAKDKRHFTVELDAKVFFTPWNATGDQTLSENDKKILKASAEKLGEHKINLMMDLTYIPNLSSKKTEISRVFDVESLEASLRYQNKIFGFEVDSSNVASITSKNKLTIFNHNQLPNNNILAMLACLDPSILSFLNDDQLLKKADGNKFLEGYNKLEQVYIDVLKDTADGYDVNKLDANIEIDLKNINDHTKHTIGKSTLADFKERVSKKVQKALIK